MGHKQPFKFGDVILFQKYDHKWRGKEIGGYDAVVSKPILALYLKSDVYDQTLGFDYAIWQKECNNKSPELGSHIEWHDYIDILGHWKGMPSFRELLNAYRKQNTKSLMPQEEINFENE